MKCKVIKIGGVLIEDENILSKLCEKLSLMDTPFILVHGGGKIANNLLTRLGITPKMIEGRRVTDKETLDVTVMAYAGMANKKVVALLQALGVNACGFSGCDLNLIEAEKRKTVQVDWGFVGDITGVNKKRFTFLIENGIVPVISPITHDAKGTLLNTNADGIAAAIAESLSADFEIELVYCFDKRGVLKDINDDKSLISCLTPQLYESLKVEGIIHSGMIPKLDNAFKSLRAGVDSVRLIRPDDLGDDNAGTIIKFYE